MLGMCRFIAAWSAACVAILSFAAMTIPASAWQMQQAKLMTPWAKNVTPTTARQEYPRPQLVRKQWLNLNGLWQYAVTPLTVQTPPAASDGEILVPFPFQSALSGVMKPFNPRMRLWYRRTVSVPSEWRGQRLLLHFGGVSWEADVFIDGKPAATHRGDYDAFTVDVTDASQGNSFQLDVAVLDPIDTGAQARGKQVVGSHSIYYTASTGIWRTVWIEPVGTTYINRLRLTPDVDAGVIRLIVTAGGADPFDRCEAVASSKGVEVGRVEGPLDSEISIPIPHAHLWDFNDPFLYDLKVALWHGSQKSDEVTSYFGMRKISTAKDAQGILRPQLNGKFIFQIGPLDQGFWPDGLYTAPTDEALRYDIQMTKKFGFNVTRKHVKVEPDRWYYWCDKLGLGVWQDMPSCDPGSDTRLTDEQAAQFQGELKAMVDGLWSHPSVIQWQVFNEAWGQHDTIPLTRWLKNYDPTRLVDAVSGFNLMPVGDVNDKHTYPGPGAPNPDASRISVLGEFGGITTQFPGHMWTDPGATFGYNKIGEVSLLASDYPTLMKKVWPLIQSPGLSAAIYTQLTDVEQEANGLMTYDRIPKVDPAIIANANQVPAGMPGTFTPAPLIMPVTPVSVEAATKPAPAGP
jgi:beta-galactosidase/beta-glucuronidase